MARSTTLLVIFLSEINLFFTLFHDVHVYSYSCKITGLQTIALGADFVLRQPKSTDSTKIYLLGNGGEVLSFGMDEGGLHIHFPVVPYGKLQHAWVFKLMYVI